MHGSHDGELRSTKKGLNQRQPIVKKKSYPQEESASRKLSSHFHPAGAVSANPMVKIRVWITITDRYKGWQLIRVREPKYKTKIVYFSTQAANSSSFCHALISQLPEWLKQGCSPLGSLGLQSASSGWSACMVLMDKKCIPILWKQVSLCCGESKGPLGYLHCIGVDEVTVNGPLQRGFRGWAFYYFTHPASPDLKGWISVVKITGICSLTQWCVVVRVEPRACVCCLRVMLPNSFRSPHIPLIMGWGHL